MERKRLLSAFLGWMNDTNEQYPMKLETSNEDIIEMFLDAMQKSNRFERVVSLGVSQPMLLAEIIKHINNCPFGYDDEGLIVSKTITTKILYDWVKKLHELSKQSN